MRFGTLTFTPVADGLDLVAEPVRNMLAATQLPDILVAEIDPALADTAAFCERYGIGLDVSANCVVVEAKRGDQIWYAACMVLATDRVDVNGIVRKHLGARKVSFAPMDMATSLSGMEYGGITPLGLPAAWPILVDTAVAQTKHVVIGSGLRTSKILLPGQLLAHLPQAQTLPITKT